MWAKELAKFFRKKEVAFEGTLWIREDGCDFAPRSKTDAKIFDALWNEGLKEVLWKGLQNQICMVTISYEGPDLVIRTNLPQDRAVIRNW